MSNNIVEFKAWPKISRDNPFNVTITEKIDGTNACIIIQDGNIVGVQSRKRFITVEDDNYGFASWVEENAFELLRLGGGYHYGEWAGPGIQKNPHNLGKKSFFLFNTCRWSDPEIRPDCCYIVPTLWQGILEKDTIQKVMDDLKDGYDGKPEGVVVYYHAFGKYTKHTYKCQGGKWRGE